MCSIGKDQGFRSAPFRGRGSRFFRRGNFGYSGNVGYNQSGYGYGNFGDGQYGYGPQNRFQPYPSRGQPRASMRARAPKKTATATVTSPNDQY